MYYDCKKEKKRKDISIWLNLHTSHWSHAEPSLGNRNYNKMDFGQMAWSLIHHSAALDSVGFKSWKKRGVSNTEKKNT